MRWIWLCLGHLWLALAALGIALPLLPTTPFLLLALACYMRGSPRFAAWLLAHPVFGPPLRDWRERGVIRRPIQIIAVIMICAGLSVPLFVLDLHWLARSLAALIALAAIIFIITRPSQNP